MRLDLSGMPTPHTAARGTRRYSLYGLGLLVGSLLLGAAAPGGAAPAPPTAPAVVIPPGIFDIPFEKYTLDNGLEVILARDSSLPRVAVNLWYHVGPRNEPAGRSGFAHLFEHLMFEGSKYAGHQFDTVIESAGGTNVNGTTNFDRTNYFETVPSEQLEPVLWLESDRMGFMIDTLTEERFEVQRGVVLNERRQSYEDRPYGPSELALYDHFFPMGHPYHGNVIGSVEDLNRATLGDVRAFFDAYYAPSNATLALVGDIDPVQAKSLIERYFAPLRKRPRPASVSVAAAPNTAPTRLVIPEAVSLAKVSMAWLLPPAFGPEDAGLELAAHILGAGKASRLYQALVVKGLATQVESWVDDNALASVFVVDAMVASGVPVEDVEHAIAESIERLALDGPGPAELARAKKGIAVTVSSSLESLNSGGGDAGRAGVLQRLNQYLGDPGRLPKEMQQLMSVEPAEVQRLTRKELGPEHRLTLVTLPRPPSASGTNPEGSP